MALREGYKQLNSILSVVTPLGAIACVYTMTGLPAKAWLMFAGWMGLGLTIYALYGYRNSVLRRGS